MPIGDCSTLVRSAEMYKSYSSSKKSEHFLLEQEVGSGAPALSSVRAGEILKRGGFACGSKQLSAFLSRLLLVLFLAKQEKYITDLS